MRFLKQMVGDLATEISKRHDTQDELMRKIVDRKEEIQRLKYTLAWDQRASRTRQQNEDLTKGIIAYEHGIESLLIARACQRCGRMEREDSDFEDEGGDEMEVV